MTDLLTLTSPHVDDTEPDHLVAEWAVGAPRVDLVTYDGDDRCLLHTEPLTGGATLAAAYEAMVELLHHPDEFC